MDYKYQPEAAHRCKRDVLLCRLKNIDDPTWKRIRPRPARNNFLGAFVLCKGMWNILIGSQMQLSSFYSSLLTFSLSPLSGYCRGAGASGVSVWGELHVCLLPGGD